MRMLFEIDKKNYADCTHIFQRDSARSIIIRDGKIAMIHSLKYDYCKFPGGGIEKGEDFVQAMIRETREEAGLTVIPETVREYGMVHRIQRGGKDPTECFIQDNYYYLCDAEAEATAQDLDDYEAREGYRLIFIDPRSAIEKNRAAKNCPQHAVMLDREARVLEMLLAEGLV